MNSSEWYEIENVEMLDSPALVVYPERIRKNINILLNILPDLKRLRPHVKTSKISEVQRMLMEEGITKFKCATIAEAEMLGMIKAPDVLLAYQPVGPKIQRFLQLVIKYPQTHFSCLIDNPDVAAELSDAFSDERERAYVWLDLNVGMDRTGVHPIKALELYKELKKFSNIEISGLHVYDGHINDSDPDRRKLQCDSAFAMVEELAKAITASDKSEVRIVAGGTPTFPIHALRKDVECSPGTFIFWDHGYGDAYADLPFEYAALLVGRVVSIIDGELLCVDLGYKSVASEKPLPRLKFLNNPRAMPVSQSEEHLVIRVETTVNSRVGDTWYAVPTHICPTVALFDSVAVINEKEYELNWKVIARNRIIKV